MKMRSCISLLAVTVLICSCDEKKEPVLPSKSYRISHIECEKDNYRQTFEYNAKGLVSRLVVSQDESWGKSGIESTYEYSDDNSVIKISADERTVEINRRVFSETLYLNANGTAKRAEGSVIVYDYNIGSELKKNYTVEFQYDSFDQLTDISISEKRADVTGWEDRESSDWKVELVWNEGNINEYSEYYTSPKRTLMNKRTYSYYEGLSFEYMPIINKPILRYFYLPLQYQGMLGKQSDCLVKRETISKTYLGEEKSSYNLDYSYDISTSIHDSRIESFNCVRSYDGEDLKYVVFWEAEQ